MICNDIAQNNPYFVSLHMFNVCFKCYSLLNEIITRIVEDWKRHDVSEEHTMIRITYLSRRFSNLIITMYVISVFLYASGTLLRYKNSNQTDGRELILKMELPFEIKSTSVYIVVLITQFIHQMSAASTTGVLNSLLIILVSFFIIVVSAKKHSCDITL